MTKGVKITLGIAFAIFVTGIVWALVAARGKEDNKSTETAKTPTLVGTPSSTATPTPTNPPTSSPAGVESKPAGRKTIPKSRIIIVEETTADFSASAWASAGTNTDGSAWSYSHVE